ncbi:hypothetical protein PJI17_31210, partial [Mycobacterium kansasii]
GHVQRRSRTALVGRSKWVQVEDKGNALEAIHCNTQVRRITTLEAVSKYLKTYGLIEDMVLDRMELQNRVHGASPDN